MIGLRIRGDTGCEEDGCQKNGVDILNGLSPDETENAREER